MLGFFDPAVVVPAAGESPKPEPLGSTTVGIAEVITVCWPLASVVVRVTGTVVSRPELESFSEDMDAGDAAAETPKPEDERVEAAPSVSSRVGVVPPGDEAVELLSESGVS